MVERFASLILVGYDDTQCKIAKGQFCSLIFSLVVIISDKVLIPVERIIGFP